MSMTITKLTEHIGADIQGVDTSAPISDETLSKLRDALFNCSVLVFRGQVINDEQHVAFTERFGRLQMTLASDPYGGGGPINRISNVDENGQIIPPEDGRSLYQAGNILWHSDGSFKLIPLRASLLSSKVRLYHLREAKLSTPAFAPPTPRLPTRKRPRWKVWWPNIAWRTRARRLRQI